MSEVNAIKRYKQTEVGLIPEDWEVRELGEVSMMKSGNTITAKSITDFGAYPCYGGNGLRGFTANYTHDGEYSLIGRQGALCGNIQYVTGKFFASEHAVVVSPKTTTDIQWLSYNLIKLNLNQYSESSAQPGLSVSKIATLPIPVPPTKAEQTAIATALSDMDQLIAGLEQLIAKKKAIKQGAMQELLRPKEGWVVKTIQEIGQVGRGRVISHKEIALSVQGLYPVYSSQTTNNGIMGYIDSYDFEGEYITWTTDGENAGTVFFRDGKFNCTNVCGTIKLKNDNPRFVAYMLGIVAPMHVSRNLANPKLMNDPMKKIEISIPSKEIQNAIANTIKEMEKEVRALEANLEKHKLLKQGMMQELLTGKTRLV